MNKDIPYIPERNRDKLLICRITSLNKFGGVLLGRDIAGVFEEGHVYQVNKIMGEIIFKDLGEHAVPEYLEDKGRINQYATSGVVMLTKQEYEHEKRLRDE